MTSARAQGELGRRVRTHDGEEMANPSRQAQGYKAWGPLGMVWK